ncbi:MAG: hypothetical protein AAGM84_03375 [Pseudomonadota bacterium]
MNILRFAPIALLAVTACDEIAVADDPDALAELRGTRSCIRAVQAETGASGATANTSVPVVEVNQYIIDVPGQASWVCYTNDENQATELVKLRGPSLPAA